MKKIYKCNLSLIRPASLKDTLLNNNKVNTGDYYISDLENIADTTIYVTKTARPNIVKEISTGYYFNIIDGRLRKFNDYMVCSIKSGSMCEVVFENQFSDLKSYLINKENVKKRIDFIGDYVSTYYLEELEICNKIKEKAEAQRKKDLKELKEIKKEDKNKKREIKRLLKK